MENERVAFTVDGRLVLEAANIADALGTPNINYVYSVALGLGFIQLADLVDKLKAGEGTSDAIEAIDDK